MSYGSLYSGSVSRLITLTNGQTTVACSGTVLTEEDLRALDTLAVGTGQVVKVASITDDDTFELLRPWAGTTQTLISTWDIVRDAPSRLDQVEAASAMTQAAGFAALVNGQTRQFRVESEGNSPPVSPVDGKYYLAGSAPTGWPITVTAGDIVKRRLGSYGVITPEEGWLAVILATGAVKRFKSGAWGVAAVTASEIAFTPAGGVAATTVQAAIAEVDSEKVTKAGGTTVGRLWRFTDTAGGLGQSLMSEDGSGNVAWGTSGGLGSLTSAGFRHGDANTPAARFDASAANVTQTASVSFSARGRPNAFEWGHGNSAGYACTFGYQSSSGRPYIVFNGEAGSSTINTIRTRGVKARGMIGDNAGGLSFFTVASANADNQTVVEDAKISAAGYLGLAGNSSPDSPIVVGTSSARANPGSGYMAKTYGEGNSYWGLFANLNYISGLHFGDPASDTVGRIEYAHNGDYMSFWTAAAERMRLDSSGHVGQGTTTPNKSAMGKAYTVNAAAAGDYAVVEVASGDVWRGRLAGSNGAVLLDSNSGLPILLRPAAVSVMTLSSGVAHHNANVSNAQSALTLANGANQNVAKPAFSSLLVAGPTGAFSVGGLTGGTDGLLCELINTTAHQMTLNNEDASSTAGNRIATDTGGNLNCKHAVLRYDATASRWRVISFRT